MKERLVTTQFEARGTKRCRFNLFKCLSGAVMPYGHDQGSWKGGIKTVQLNHDVIKESGDHGRTGPLLNGFK